MGKGEYKNYLITFFSPGFKNCNSLNYFFTYAHKQYFKGQSELII